MQGSPYAGGESHEAQGVASQAYRPDGLPASPEMKSMRSLTQNPYCKFLYFRPLQKSSVVVLINAYIVDLK